MVKTHWMAVRCSAHVDQQVVVKGVVLETPEVLVDGIPDECTVLAFGLRSVGAQGIDQRDVGSRNPGIEQFIQHHRQDAVVGCRPGDVGVDNHDVTGGIDAVGKRGTLDWRAQCLFQCRLLRRNSGQLGGLDDVRTGRHFDRQSGASVGNLDLHV